MALLGFLTIAVLLFLIMTKKLSTILALILVPTVFALLGGAGAKVGTFIVNGIKNISPTGTMFIFAVLFFGILTDAGMFDPVINGILKTVGRDPLKVTIASAVLAMLVHLDGSGVVTFSITVPAMLPLFEELRMDKRVLACVVALAAGTMNIVPWGGPTLRAATSLNLPITTVYNPVLVPQLAGLVCVLAIAYMLGMKERKRLGVTAQGGGVVERSLTESEKKLRRPHLFWFNVIVTVVALVALIKAWQTPTVVFMIAFAITLLVNYPNPKMQAERINAHAQAALLMASVLFAAGAFTGIMKDSKMLEAMTKFAVSAIPKGLGAHLPLIVGIFAMPLSLVFDPDSYYFGVLPVLASTVQGFGVEGVQVARASILGQMTVGFPLSPLTPATLLLIGLCGIDLGDHQRFSFKWAWLTSLVALVVALILGVISV
ncbi:MAG TPA: citrate transporter [Firmicutes bacterium]|nr:citrate transporter [Bacillota bacterium]